MKNYLYCLFSLLFISCASKSIESQVINDFIKEQAGLKYYYNIVVEEAPSRMLPLEYYEKAYQDRNIRIGDKIRIMPNGRRPYTWPIDTLEIKTLKEKYKNDTITYYWKKKDFIKENFAGKDFKILKMNQRLPNTPEFTKYEGGDGLIISRPIIVNSNKYALFYYCPYSIGGHTGGSCQAILTENVDGKWKTIKTYSDPNVIN
ncbi:hypothetical protein D3C85_589870 [compost metagenome]